MISLPLDPSLTLMAMSDPAPQIKNRQTGEVAVDSVTNEPVFQLDVAMSVPGGKPLTLQLALPKSGIDESVTQFSPFHAVGLVYLTGEKNGRTWSMYRCQAITPLLTASVKAA